MSIQQLLAQLGGMWGNPQTTGGVGGMTQQQIADAMGGMYEGETQEMITGAPQMFQTMTPELMQSASIGAYSPLLQQKQGSLASQLGLQLQGKGIRKAHGGFAGSGGSQMAEQQARDVYGKGMGDTLTQAMGARTASLGSMQDIINQWLQTAQGFAAG